MNARVITSHGLAMLSEHGKLLFHSGRIIAHVAGIAVLCHQRERHFLAVTPDQQRDMWFLDTLGLINGTTHLIIVALEVRLLLGPHRQNDLNRLAQMTQTLRGLRILIAIGAIFVLIPARPDAKVQATMREHVYSARHFGQQRRMAIAIARDHLADAYVAGITRQRSRTHPAFKRHFRRRVGDRMKVVNQPGGSETNLVSRLSHTRHRFVGFHRVLDPCQIHGPALGNKQTKLQCHVCDSFFFGKWKTLVFFYDVLRSPLTTEITKVRRFHSGLAKPSLLSTPQRQAATSKTSTTTRMIRISIAFSFS